MWTNGLTQHLRFIRYSREAKDRFHLYQIEWRRCCQACQVEIQFGVVVTILSLGVPVTTSFFQMSQKAAGVRGIWERSMAVSTFSASLYGPAHGKHFLKRMSMKNPDMKSHACLHTCSEIHTRIAITFDTVCFSVWGAPSRKGKISVAAFSHI